MNKFYREIALLIVVLFTTLVLGQESRKVVAIVDTGLPYNTAIIPYLCKGLQLDITNRGIQDYSGHGTNVMGIVAKGIDPKTHCISMVKWWHVLEEPKNSVQLDEDVSKYMKYLISIKPTLVNMSLSGKGFSAPEFNGIKTLLAMGAKVVVSAGNNGQDLSSKCDIYPACYAFKNPNYFVAGTFDAFSNKNGPVTNILQGVEQCGIFGLCLTGTSQAAANLSARLLQGEK